MRLIVLDKNCLWNLTTGSTQALVATGTSNAAWTSSNSSVATVSDDGVVTALATGATIITCTANGVSSSITINVLPHGDVNRDGSITIADVTALVNIILGK